MQQPKRKLSVQTAIDDVVIQYSNILTMADIIKDKLITELTIKVFDLNITNESDKLWMELLKCFVEVRVTFSEYYDTVKRCHVVIAEFEEE